MSVAIIILLLIIVLGLSSTILWIWALVDLTRNQTLDTNTKIVWVIVVLIFPFIGSIVYLVVGRTQGQKTA